MNHWVKKSPQYGDHIKVSRGLYSHHGIFINENEVICYSGEPTHIDDAEVIVTTLHEFLCGRSDKPTGAIEVNTTPARYSPEEIVSRAKSCLGEREYGLFTNNCEHFANWCRLGEGRSEQIDTAKNVSFGIAAGAILAGGIAFTAKMIADNKEKKDKLVKMVNKTISDLGKIDGKMVNKPPVSNNKETVGAPPATLKDGTNGEETADKA